MYRVYVDAEAALKLLGVKRQTLYAYAARGLIARAPGADGRRRLYKRTDLERLRARHDARSGHGPTAAGALRFGEPILESSITCIDARGPVYRGQPATALAESNASFESVAELLWDRPRVDPRAWRSAARAAVPPLPPRGAPISRLIAAVSRAALDDRTRFEAPRDEELARGRRIIHLLATTLGAPRSPARVAGRVARALGAPESKEADRAIEIVLILLADHELNSSSFAARVTASTGADLFACIISGLAALSGPEHGTASDRVEALIASIGAPDRAASTIRSMARRGEAIPGFGHRIYTDGDPRCAPLLSLAHAIAPRSRAVRTTVALVDAMRDAGHEAASVDVGLVALTAALRLPHGSGSALFAVSRCAGWIAHVLGQRAQGFLLRPRARYIGVK